MIDDIIVISQSSEAPYNKALSMRKTKTKLIVQSTLRNVFSTAGRYCRVSKCLT